MSVTSPHTLSLEPSSSPGLPSVASPQNVKGPVFGEPPSLLSPPNVSCSGNTPLGAAASSSASGSMSSPRPGLPTPALAPPSPSSVSEEVREERRGRTTAPRLMVPSDLNSPARLHMAAVSRQHLEADGAASQESQWTRYCHIVPVTHRVHAAHPVVASCLDDPGCSVCWSSSGRHGQCLAGSLPFLYGISLRQSRLRNEMFMTLNPEVLLAWRTSS